MLPSMRILSLGFLLPVTFSSIDLKLQPDYLKNNEGSSIDYTTCEVNDAHDYEDDADYSPGEVCHYTHYEKRRIEVEFPGVRSCCPFHGHISSTKNCEGRDKDGNQVIFEKAEVCVKPIEGQDNHIAGKTSLNCKSQKVKGIYENNANLSMENGIQVLHVGNKTYTNFCLGIRCDSNDENFEHQYEACEETIATTPAPLDGQKCCGKLTDQAET